MTVWWIAVFLAISGLQDVRAQDRGAEQLTSLSLEQLLGVDIDKVYSASRFVQDVRRAPASVTIITADAIRRFGYRTLADALRSAAGFYTTYDRNYTYLGVRGFGRPGDYNGRVLVLIDGHRYNDGVYDEALIGTEFPIDLALVERIEVIRGPSSSLYGSSAFFGVINVITRHGSDVRSGEAQFDVGTLATRRARVSGGSRTSSGLEYLVSGTTYYSGGQSQIYFPEYDSPATNGGVAKDLDDDRSRNLFGRMSYGDFSVEAGWISRTKHVPTAAFDTVFADRGFKTTDGRLFATAQYGHRLDERTEVVGRLFFDAMRYRGRYPYMNDADLLDGSAWNGVGGEFIASHRFAGRNATTGGIEVHNNYRLDQWSETVGEPDSLFTAPGSSRTWALFAQHEFTVMPSLVINAGLRYDHDAAFGGSVNPRLGVIVMPSPATTFKVLYGTAFRAPSAYELNYWAGQPPLNPETIHASEVIWEQRVGDRLRTSVSGFYNEIANLITERTFNGPNDIHYVNSDRATARGVEMSLEGHWAHGVLTRFGHTLSRTEDGRTGEELSNAPRQLSKMQVAAPVGTDRLMLGLEGEYVGRRLTVRGSEASGFYRQSLTLDARRVIGRLDARITIGNLFDRQYGDPGSEEHRQTVITQDGRTALVTLGYRF